MRCCKDVGLAVNGCVDELVDGPVDDRLVGTVVGTVVGAAFDGKVGIEGGRDVGVAV